jgi:hypothetical protein
MIDERICPVCNLSFFPNCSTHKYCCEACAEEGNREWHRQNYRNKLKNARLDPRQQQWELISDPDPYGLLPGLMLSEDEKKFGLKNDNFSQGAILYNRKKHVTYKVDGNKLRIME